MNLSSLAFAEEAASYKSNGGTSFYGTYEYPEEEKESESASEKKESESVQVNQSKEQILPATGDNHHVKTQAVGIIIFGSTLLYIQRKRKINHEKNTIFNSWDHVV